jgi:DNA-binding XRE family transcriptional regulator
MCELNGMATTITELRAELGLTLEAFAERVGLSSKGYASELERGGRCSVKVALEIEKLSGGRIPAASLNPDVALVEAARRVTADAQRPSAEAAA